MYEPRLAHSPNAGNVLEIIFPNIAKSLIASSLTHVWNLVNTSIPNKLFHGTNPNTSNTNNNDNITI